MAEKPSKWLRSIAYHEAGHVVAAYVLRRRFTSVSAITDDHTLGRCSYEKWLSSLKPEYGTSPKKRNMVEALAITVMAGAQAEAVLDGRRNWVAYDSDRQRAFDLIDSLCDDTDETWAYFGWLWERTRLLVRNLLNSAAIEELADAVLDGGFIEATRRRPPC